MKSQTLNTGLVTTLLTAVLMVGCAKSSMQSTGTTSASTESSIVNGTDASESDTQTGALANPVVAIFAMLNEQTGEGALCTGTLISPTVILTAGHCVADATPTTKIYVSFQAKDWTAHEGLTVLAKSFVIHPGYANAQATKTVDQADDLALILLSEAAPAAVTPATLADKSVVLTKLTGVTDVGYGVSDDRNNAQQSGAGVLRYTQFAANEIELYKGKGALKGMIIADGSKTSVCHGDSGGPLFAGSPSDATHLVVGVNDLVLPQYEGQEQTDYEAAEKAGNMDDFYKKYPDAHNCLGYNAFVDVASHLPWIKDSSAKLIADAAAAVTTNPAQPTQPTKVKRRVTASNR